MKNLFVPYELALLAKEKGFDEPCFGLYYANTRDFPVSLEIRTNTESNSKFIRANAERLCVAPLYQQIIDWFREKHNLAVLISIPFDVFWRYSINGVNGNGYYTDSTFKEKVEFANYYEALNKAIEEAFKLIK